MKQRPSGFLSNENIDHDSDICELHDYLWRYVMLHKLSASGVLHYYIDSVLIEQESIRTIPKKMYEIIQKFGPKSIGLHLDEWSLMDVRRCMVEYAKLMCDEQKQICLYESVVFSGFDWMTEMPSIPYVNRSSVIDAPYPEELR